MMLRRSADGPPHVAATPMRRRQVLAGLALAFVSVDALAAGRPFRIAYLALTPDEDKTFERIFAERLEEMGLRQGENLELTFYSAGGRADHLRELAAKAVAGAPDVLVSGFGTLAAKAAAAAATTTPVVFTCVGDPLGAGLVTNLGRPGGHVTGISAQVSDLGGKRLQFIRELAPGARRIGVLLNPETPFSALALGDIMKSAGEQGLIDPIEITAADQISPRLYEAVSRGVAALIVLEDPFTLSQRKAIVAAANSRRLPAIYGIRDFVEAGGLASYGPDLRQNFRRAADHYVESIRRGVKPGDLPVEQPTRFELVVNAATARDLGLNVPGATLAQADDVIE